MTQTPYFNLNLAEGSDIFNPLTTDNPNYSAIDTALHNIQLQAVYQAQATRSGTVHAITRTTKTGTFYFVAGAAYVAGDTFTVDGTPVTAALPSGESLPDGAFAINANVLCILTGTVLTVYTGQTMAAINAAINAAIPMPKLWQATGSTQGEASISINLSGYTAALVLYSGSLTAWTTNTADVKSVIIPLGSSGRLDMISNLTATSAFILSNRTCGVSAAGLALGAPSHKNGANPSTPLSGQYQSALSPVAVYGIR